MYWIAISSYEPFSISRVISNSLAVEDVAFMKEGTEPSAPMSFQIHVLIIVL